MEKANAFKDVGLRLFVLSLFISTAWSATHKHLGCWMDTTASPDLDGLVTTPDTMTLDTCVKSCNKAGFAYSGMQSAKSCNCGNKYGRHGVSNSCNYTCNGIPCGAVDANDVYYAIDTDITVRARRELIGYNDPKSYWDARMDCVKGNGDLAVMRNPGYFNRLITAANDSGIKSDQVWIGLFWNNNNKYVWTDPSISGLNPAVTSPYWKSDEKHDLKCVVLSLSAKNWKTASCDTKFPYICFQLPQNAGEAATLPPDDTEFVETEEEKSFLADNRKIVFYIVLPLFVACYGGSCVIYAIGKAWRYFKWKKRAKAREAMIASSTEFEPDTKPLTLPDRRPLTSRDVKMEEGYTCSPPPYYRLNSRASKNRSPEEKEKPVHTPIEEFKPDEDMKPRTQSRVSRRSELLENAYSESKERRRREGRTPEPQARPRSSRSPRMTDLDVPPIPPPPTLSPKPRRSMQCQVAAAVPEEQDIDYTKLSIGDIMFIRGLMSTAEGEKRRKTKPKKIIVS